MVGSCNNNSVGEMVRVQCKGIKGGAEYEVVAMMVRVPAVNVYDALPRPTQFALGL